MIKIADLGFVTYKVESSVTTNYLSCGYVIENVSDEVALSVRVETEFTDDAGEPIDTRASGNDFTVVLPGQQLGADGNAPYEGPVIGDMEVKITMIGGLDTPDGERHRDR